MRELGDILFVCAKVWEMKKKQGDKPEILTSK